LFFLQTLDPSSKSADFSTQPINQPEALAPVAHGPGVLALPPRLPRGEPDS
jgi:hypothetical protein